MRTFLFAERGIFVIGFSYPVVPKGKASIPITMALEGRVRYRVSILIKRRYRRYRG